MYYRAARSVREVTCTTNRDYFSAIHNDSSPFFREEKEAHKSPKEKTGCLDRSTWIEDYGDRACIVIYLVINSNYQPKQHIRHIQAGGLHTDLLWCAPAEPV